MLSQRQKMRPPSEVPVRSKTGYKRSRRLARWKSVWCGAGLCMAMAFVLAVALFLGLFLGRPHKGFAATGLKKGEVQVYEYEVVAEFPHDPNAFTQGLLYYKDDILYESTGLNGQSSVRRVDLASGEVRQLKRLGSQYFGEGLTLWNDRLLQVLWLTTQGFIYNRENLSQVGTFTQPMRDGWGLTGDATQLIGSDGTSTLYFINPDTFAEIRNITVTDGGRKVTFLNELEYIGDDIWANVWQKECIVRICPKDGRVKAWILLTGLRDSIYKGGYKGRQLDVLNGIAWDSKQERLFVTGKLWPKLFQIKLRSPSAGSNITVESARATCIISNQR